MNEEWHQVGIDDGLDWWLVLDGEELTHADTGEKFGRHVFGVDVFTENIKVLDLNQ